MPRSGTSNDLKRDLDMSIMGCPCYEIPSKLILVSTLFYFPSPQRYASLLSQKTPPSPKKKHVCSTCQRSFTTSAHLARHSKVHTRERNHTCPFPGCKTRCSRQDNLQQQSVPFFFLISPCTNSILFSYRIHLSLALVGFLFAQIQLENAPPSLLRHPGLQSLSLPHVKGILP